MIISEHSFSGARIAIMLSTGKTPSDRAVLWHMSGGRCFWCDHTMNLAGNPTGDVFMTLDHLHPFGQRGKLPNLKLAACRRCNNERGSMSAEQYWQKWAARLAA